MMTELVALLERQEIQVEASCHVRQQLAHERCKCGMCERGDVYECDACSRFQPACLLEMRVTTTSALEQVVCAGGCRER